MGAWWPPVWPRPVAKLLVLGWDEAPDKRNLVLGKGQLISSPPGPSCWKNTLIVGDI